MVVKTYRGQIPNDGEDRIRLSTIRGKVGYKIVKFQIMPQDPTGSNIESVVGIWKTTQTPSAIIDFTNSDMLAMAYYSGSSGASGPQDMIVVFDNEIFNQDIFISLNDNSSAPTPINYYIELEVIPLDDAGAEYTTLKDMRQA